MCIRPTRWIGAALIGFAFAAAAWAPAPAEATEVFGELKRWHAVELQFAGPEHAETDSSPNPFLDYRLQCRFTGPSGQLFDVPGFDTTSLPEGVHRIDAEIDRADGSNEHSWAIFEVAR